MGRVVARSRSVWATAAAFVTLFMGTLIAQSGGGQAVSLPPSSPAVSRSPVQPPPVRRPSVLPAGDRMAYMRTVSEALGVDCGYCHGGRGGSTPSTPPVTSTGRQRVEVAREMFLMVERLNAAVREATGKAPSEATRVTCATCHRGVPIPKQIGDVVWETALELGGEAAVTQYRELRSQFFGRQAYDFGEQALILVTERLANVRPEAAVALLRMNIDFHPGSVQSRISLAYALTRARDYQGAIAALREALSLDPANGVAKGMLAQLDQ